ncbi:MAG: trypsin-like peptidase domain-containing protein, partial [bacterium]
MDRIKRHARTPFASALLGGLVVALLGWLAIAAGWVKADGDGPTVAATPLTEPASDTGDGKGRTVNDIYSAASPGVAFVQAEIQPDSSSRPFSPFGPQDRGGVATGSAFVIDGEGHLLTNAHVVAGADQVSVKLGEDGDTLDAKVVGRDPSTDVALLEVDPPEGGLTPLPLADSDQVEVGDPAVAIGNPFGLDRTATAGIVSAIQRQISAPNGFTISDVIQTDAPINPGNSGGPLLDAAGRVVGINSQIEAGSGGGNVGIGFAVPINTARSVAEQLLGGGEVEHAFLGITGGDVTSEIADALNLQVDHGAIVQEVVGDGPADQAGVEAGTTDVTVAGQQIRAGGDVITEVDGQAVGGMDDVIAAVNGKQPGEQVELTLVRKGEERTVTVELGDRP